MRTGRRCLSSRRRQAENGDSLEIHLKIPVSHHYRRGLTPIRTRINSWQNHVAVCRVAPGPVTPPHFTRTPRSSDASPATSTHALISTLNASDHYRAEINPRPASPETSNNNNTRATPTLACKKTPSPSRHIVNTNYRITATASLPRVNMSTITG